MDKFRNSHELEQALREAGCRISRQRRAILECLSSTKVHPSARWVFEEVRKKEPGLSLATVYNTLGTLVRKGLIKVLEFESLDNRYETNLTLHINLVCTNCGKIQDLQEHIAISPKQVKERVGFDVLDYRMEYYGLCEDCGDKSGGNPFASVVARSTRTVRE